MSSQEIKKSERELFDFDVLLRNYFSLMRVREKDFSQIEIIGEFIKNDMCLTS